MICTTYLSVLKIGEVFLNKYYALRLSMVQCILLLPSAPSAERLTSPSRASASAAPTSPSRALMKLIVSSVVLNFVTILWLQLLAFAVLCNNLVQAHVEPTRAV